MAITLVSKNLTKCLLMAISGITLFFGIARAQNPVEIHMCLESAEIELAKEFGFAKPIGIGISVFNDRRSFHQVLGYKAPLGVVGTLSDDQRTMLILNPDIWETEEKQFVNFQKLIKHEIVHAYTAKISNTDSVSLTCSAPSNKREKKGRSLQWFEEGLATVLSGQMDEWKSMVDARTTKYGFDDILSIGGYPAAGSAVKFLIEKFGKDRLFLAIKNMPTFYYQSENFNTSSCILYSVLGVDQESLELLWHTFLQKRRQQN